MFRLKSIRPLLICIVVTIVAGIISRCVAQDFILDPWSNKLNKIGGSPAPIQSVVYQADQTAKSNNRLQTGNTCITNTFYLHLPASGGEKLALSRLQTFPDGNYLAAATVTLADGSKEGLLMVIAGDGSIMRQQRLKIDNKSVIITDGSISVKGNLTVAGVFNDGSQAIFVARLKEDLSVSWAKTITQNAVPVQVNLGIIDDYSVLVVAQLPGMVAYGYYDVNGVQRWTKAITPASLTDVTGIYSLNGTMGIVTNCVNNGRQLVRIFEINPTNGALVNTSLRGDAIAESKALAVTPFSSRVNVLGITKDISGAYTGFRNNFYTATIAETVHSFTVPLALDFSATAAMDNAGDALGYFLPASKELVFIKHFSAYSTSTEFSQKYIVTNGASIAGITRSLDGGYLFAVNTQGSAEIVLIKTDSTGILPGCGQQPINVPTTETLNVPNTVSTAGVTSPVNNVTISSAGIAAAAYTTLFDCRQSFCPADPIADTCLSTYYKTYRSGSYIDLFGGYCLLKNNKQLLSTRRYDRTFGNSNQETYGLKLLDEKGALIQAVDTYNDTASQQTVIYKMDDSQVMLLAYSPLNGNQRFNFTLVDDNLVKKWSKTIVTNSDFYSAGVGIIDMHKDQEGNFYAIATRVGFPPVKPAVFIYKMDPQGNQLWTRAYETNNGIFETASITSTSGSVVIVIEGSNPGLISLRLDKATGQVQNSYSFDVSFDGSIYKRMLKYDAGLIFYTGSDKNSRLLMGLFDTTGRPIRIRYGDMVGTAIQSSAVKDGNLFATYISATVSGGYKEILLKTDSALNISFANQYNMERYRVSHGLAVSDAGNIYSAGTFSYGGVNAPYTDNFIIKYGAKGEVGTCDFQPFQINFTDLPPAPLPVTWTPVSRNYQNADFSLSLVNSAALLNVNNILCSSPPACTFIQLANPGPVCRLNTNYTIHYKKDALCTLLPQWQYDTSYASLQHITDSTALFQFKKTGVVTLRAALSTGCHIYTDSLLIKIQTSSASLSLGADTTVCTGDSLQLHAGAGFASYTWQDGSTDSVYIAKSAGQYFVQVSNTCNGIVADTINIAAVAVPPLNLGPDINACLKDSVTLTAAAAFISYQWQPAFLITGVGNVVKVITPKDTTITIFAKNINGCIAKDTVLIHLIAARPVNLGADTSFCAADSILLNAGSGYAQYAWSNGNNTQYIHVSKSGSYHVSAKDINGCFARDTLIVLQTFATPVITLGPDRDICTGQQLILNAGKFAGYLWNDGSITPTITVTTTGKYKVSVTDSHRCTNSDSVIIKNLLPLPTAFLKTTDSICNYGKLTIVPTATYSSYQWSDGSEKSTFTVSQPGLYSLTVTDSKGCKGSDSLYVVSKQCMSGFFVPNVFSPNRDRLNDAFKALVYGPVANFYFQIYNRFGQLVFTTTDPQQTWDGLFKGAPCDVGNYIWQCHYQFIGSQPVYEKGFVMLMR